MSQFVTKYLRFDSEPSFCQERSENTLVSSWAHRVGLSRAMAPVSWSEVGTGSLARAVLFAVWLCMGQTAGTRGPTNCSLAPLQADVQRLQH